MVREVGAGGVSARREFSILGAGFNVFVVEGLWVWDSVLGVG